MAGTASIVTAAEKFRHLTAPQIRDHRQARGNGGAAKEIAIFAQFESAFGLTPGAGGIQHLLRLMGRGRALEALFTAGDFDAELSERYGWVNRAVPAAEIDAFTKCMARRIASFPPIAAAAIKRRVNAVALATEEEFRVDSDMFGEAIQEPEV